MSTVRGVLKELSENFSWVTRTPCGEEVRSLSGWWASILKEERRQAGITPFEFQGWISAGGWGEEGRGFEEWNLCVVTGMGGVDGQGGRLVASIMQRSSRMRKSGARSTKMRFLGTERKEYKIIGKMVKRLYELGWARTDERVMAALGHDSSWRMKHTCPACMYKLEGEDVLIFEMLSTIDGNDSLKRVLRRDKSSMAQDETGELTLARSSEREDSRDASDGYYISRERVDPWAKSRLGDRLPIEAANMDEDNPCAEQWKNMINDVTSRMWGIFDETGIFLALYRHGFVLVIADMIKSRELDLAHLVWQGEVPSGGGVGVVGGIWNGARCWLRRWLSLPGHYRQQRAWGRGTGEKTEMFDGFLPWPRPQRLCQLRFLATYVEGMGLEDLEGFHRQQEITTYAKHFDSFETYANLSQSYLYLVALTILKTEPALRAWMRQEGVDSMKMFHEWLEEEKTYLLGLKAAAKTNTEMLEMEYVQKLVNLGASQAKSQVVAAEARHARGDDGTYTPGVTKAELWVETVTAIKQRKYQLTLDVLELLIVERIFELTKMNQSETGYKMRKHIAKALQARSKAVKNAIDRYNDAAALLEPLMPKLSWEEVIEYAFLADFDILTLRVRKEIKHLNVEIQCMITWIWDENRFLRRIEANLRDGTGKTEEDVETDTMMAVQLRLYQGRCGRFDAGHLRNFTKLAAEPGFTGSLKCGVAVEQREVENCLRDLQAELASTAPTDGVEVDGGAGERGPTMELDPGAAAAEAEEVAADAHCCGPEMGEDDEGDDGRDEAVLGLLYQIYMLAMDGAPQGEEE
ncbi:hypothetical protein DFH08DRAFT_819863 [Mycena albidolilacea]|uniref:Uncharacterized protein n=1 Tax=Mycena albidolilacea TaxID=1033008 RepID=A0AAD6ZDI1_9AGAR|nr:hypothetical protein DFH08DRAFT_819863 [Mycena albidolilacea]